MRRFTGFVFVFTLFLIFIFSGHAFGQDASTDFVLPSSFSKLPLTIEAAPEFPGPYKTVVLKAVSYSIDLDRSTLTWRVSGTTVKKGIGEKTVEITTGKVGSETRITLEATSNQGVQSASKTIRPGEVDLAWEALSYVPPFYKGKALASFESTVKIVATPNMIKNGVRLGAKDLIYTWKRNGKIDQAQSGYGKNVYKYKLPSTAVEGSIILDVRTSDNAVTTRSGLTIPITPTALILYEDDPKLGLKMEQALGGTVGMDRPEIKLFAAPFWSSLESLRDGSLQFKWRQNNEILEGNTQSITFGVDRDKSGQSDIGVEISNDKKFLQFASASIRLKYGN